MTTRELLTRFILRGHEDDKTRRARCSFCGRPHDQVNKLVAGPSVYICDQCVENAARIIAASEEPRN